MKTIYKYFHLFIVVIMTLFVSCSLSGCMFFLGFSGYYGDYPALYTMACHILDTEGYYQDAEFESQAAVVPVETDSCGRTLFVFCDNNDYEAGNYALMICQYYTDEKVYYYQDYNYLLKKPEKENGVVMYIQKLSPAEPSIIKDPLYGFSDDEITLLKDRNDWNKPFDKRKCVSADIFDDYAEYIQSVKHGLYKNIESFIKPIFESLCLDEGWNTKAKYIHYIDEDLYNNIFIRFNAYPISSSSQQSDKYRVYFGLISKSYGVISEKSFIFIGEFDQDHTFRDFYYSSAYLDALYNFHTNTYWNVCDLDEVIAQQTSASR